MSWNAIPRGRARGSISTSGTTTLERPPLPTQRSRPDISGPQPVATELFGPPPKAPVKTRSHRRRNRRKRRILVQVIAVIAAVVGASSYFFVSGNDQVAPASRHIAISAGNQTAPQFITRAKAKGYAQAKHSAK